MFQVAIPDMDQVFFSEWMFGREVWLGDCALEKYEKLKWWFVIFTFPRSPRLMESLTLGAIIKLIAGRMLPWHVWTQLYYHPILMEGWYTRGYEASRRAIPLAAMIKGSTSQTSRLIDHPGFLEMASIRTGETFGGIILMAG